MTSNATPPAPLPRIASGSRHLVPDAVEWQRTDAPGFWIKPLLADADGGGSTLLMRIDPGAYVGSHSHDQLEEILVLEGEFTDDDRTHKPGDYCLRAIGAPHVAGSKTGCTVLVVYRK